MKTKALKTAKILNVILVILMAAIGVLFVLLPFACSYYPQYFTQPVPTLIFCYTAGALALWFLFDLRLLVLSVCKGNPFVKRNADILKRLSFALLFLLFDFIFIFCFLPSVSKLLCICLLLLGVFCARVLAYLIERAAEYREEVDLTV